MLLKKKFDALWRVAPVSAVVVANAGCAASRRDTSSMSPFTTSWTKSRKTEFTVGPLRSAPYRIEKGLSLLGREKRPVASDCQAWIELPLDEAPHETHVDVGHFVERGVEFNAVHVGNPKRPVAHESCVAPYAVRRMFSGTYD